MRKNFSIFFLFLIVVFTMISCQGEDVAENGFKVSLGEPVVVGQGPTVEESWWGYYQFPSVCLTSDSKIYVSVALGHDSIDDYENDQRKNYLSVDNGRSWVEADAKVEFTKKGNGLKMQNGKNFCGFIAKNGYTASWIDNYKPAVYFKDRDFYMYYLKDIEELSNVFTAEEYDEKTDTFERFQATVNWEYMPLIKIGNRLASQANIWDMIEPTESLFALTPQSGMIQLDDGTLIFTMYSHGVDCQTGEAVTSAFNVYLFSSVDSGRTWNYYSQILTKDEYVKSGNEGLCEPSIARAPDGSYVMLMRTGENKPSYIARSTDNCRTWSEPEIFDNVGVFPQVVSLKCGVTLASYGRPGLFFRWTGDPSAKKWNHPIDLGITSDIKNHGKYSCCYTRILPLSENTALLVYMDFQYPSKEDPEKKVKTILAREIVVSKK